MDPLVKIQSIFEKYTTSYHFYLRDLVNGKEYELGVKKRYPICSCFKLAVLMAYFDSIKNESELFEEVVIHPEKFSPGGGVINYFTTPVKFTYFQLAQMMMAFSDGTSTDLLIEKVGMERVSEIISQLSIDSKITNSISKMLTAFQSAEKENRLSTMSHVFEKSLIDSDYSNAKDLARLAKDTFEFTKRTDFSEKFSEVLFAKKMIPLTSTYFGDEYRVASKTGSIGYGYFINDCGLILKGNKAILNFAYATEGWSINKNISEVILSLIGLEIIKVNNLEIIVPDKTLKEGTRDVLDIF